jgi:hypothetical protein
MMHRSGARLTEIAQLMRHSDLQMLKRYLDLAGEDAANAHRWHGLMDALTRQQATWLFPARGIVQGREHLQGVSHDDELLRRV